MANEIQEFTVVTNPLLQATGIEHLLDRSDPYRGGIRYWVLPDGRIHFNEYDSQGQLSGPMYLMGRQEFLTWWNGNYQGFLRARLRESLLKQVFHKYTGLELSKDNLDPMQAPILDTNNPANPPQPFTVLERKRGRKEDGRIVKNSDQSQEFQAQNDLLLRIRASYCLDPDPQPELTDVSGSTKTRVTQEQAQRVNAMDNPAHHDKVEQHIKSNRPVLYLHPEAWDLSKGENELSQTLLTRDVRRRKYFDKDSNNQDIPKPFLKNTKHRIVAAKVLVLATMTRELPQPCPAVIVTACAPNFMNYGLGYQNEDLGRYLNADHSALKDHGRPYKEDLKRIFKSSLYAMDQQDVEVGLIPLFGGGAYLSLLSDQAIAPHLSPKAHARQMIHEALIEAFYEMKTAGQFQHLEKIVYCLPRSEHKSDRHSSAYEAARTTLKVRQREPHHPEWNPAEIELSEADILEEAVHFQEGKGKSVGILNAGSNTTIGGAFQNPYYGSGPLEECLSCATTLARQCAFDEVQKQGGRLADQYNIRDLVPAIVGHLPANEPGVAARQASGTVKPILVEFDNSAEEADIDRQAREILTAVLKEYRETGKPVGLTYSANQAQVLQIYENEHKGRGSYQRMTGANQAQVVDKIIELLGTGEYETLQPHFHILPFPTMNGIAESRSTADQGPIQVSQISNALCHAACFVGAGGTLLAWQNQHSKGKHELAAIGGGIAGNDPRVQDQIQNGLRQIHLLTDGKAQPQKVTDPAITAAFQEGQRTHNHLAYWKAYPPLEQAAALERERRAAATFKSNSAPQQRGVDGASPKPIREVRQEVCREPYQLDGSTYQLSLDSSALSNIGEHRLLIHQLGALTLPSPASGRGMAFEESATPSHVCAGTELEDAVTPSPIFGGGTGLEDAATPSPVFGGGTGLEDAATPSPAYEERDEERKSSSPPLPLANGGLSSRFSPLPPAGEGRVRALVGSLTYQEPDKNGTQSLSLTLTHPDGSNLYEHLAIAMIKFVRAQGHTEVEVPPMKEFEQFKAAVEKHNGEPKLQITFSDEAAGLESDYTSPRPQ